MGSDAFKDHIQIIIPDTGIRSNSPELIRSLGNSCIRLFLNPSDIIVSRPVEFSLDGDWITGHITAFRPKGDIPPCLYLYTTARYNHLGELCVSSMFGGRVFDDDQLDKTNPQYSQNFYKSLVEVGNVQEKGLFLTEIDLSQVSASVPHLDDVAIQDTDGPIMMANERIMMKEKPTGEQSNYIDVYNKLRAKLTVPPNQNILILESKKNPYITYVLTPLLSNSNRRNLEDPWMIALSIIDTTSPKTPTVLPYAAFLCNSLKVPVDLYTGDNFPAILPHALIKGGIAISPLLESLNINPLEDLLLLVS